MSTLSNHLETFLKKSVIVVMDDGMAYFGQLQEFDEEFLILDHVKEAEYQKKPVWKEPRIKFSVPPVSHQPGEKKETVADFVDERIVGKSLTTVLINLSHVLRVWGDDFGEEEG